MEVVASLPMPRSNGRNSTVLKTGCHPVVLSLLPPYLIPPHATFFPASHKPVFPQLHQKYAPFFPTHYSFHLSAFPLRTLHSHPCSHFRIVEWRAPTQTTNKRRAELLRIPSFDYSSTLRVGRKRVMLYSLEADVLLR